MHKVHILHEGYYHRNGESFLFPLKVNAGALLKSGIKLRMYTGIAPPLMQCDALCLSSRFFSSWWKDYPDRITEFIAQARKKVSTIIWFDISDSTGTTQFKVLPLVDKYLKGQVLKDRGAYKKTYYGLRIFTDFYHRNFGIEDAAPAESHLNIIPRDEDLCKIGISWNSGMANYSYYGLTLGRLWHKAGALPRFYPQKWYSPAVGRPIVLSCRIGDSYPRQTISFLRKEMKKRLVGRVALGKVSRRRYFRELAQSIACISPFGFGEICYRDFESMIYGAAMVKQDMSHLETWPALWRENETYLPLAWDFSDFQEKIDFIYRYPQKVVGLAYNAQQLYKNYLCAENGRREFCERFKEIVRS